MQFKRTQNLKTQKEYYYVDNKRVSEDKFYFKKNLCLIEGKEINSIIVENRKNIRRSFFSMN